jgi:hypothetical protein
LVAAAFALGPAKVRDPPAVRAVFDQPGKHRFEFTGAVVGVAGTVREIDVEGREVVNLVGEHMNEAVCDIDVTISLRYELRPILKNRLQTDQHLGFQARGAIVESPHIKADIIEGAEVGTSRAPTPVFKIVPVVTALPSRANLRVSVEVDVRGRSHVLEQVKHMAQMGEGKIARSLPISVYGVHPEGRGAAGSRIVGEKIRA